MSRLVQIRGESPVFPGNACVHCLKPATQTVEIVKIKDDGAVRKIKAPFCDDCIALRRAKTMRQVQFERLAVGSSLVLALTLGAWIYSRTNTLGRPMWGALLGMLVALIAFGIMYMIIQPWAQGFQSRETRAIRRAVSIREFDWDTTLIEFENEEYAEQFAQLNPPQT